MGGTVIRHVAVVPTTPLILTDSVDLPGRAHAGMARLAAAARRALVGHADQDLVIILIGGATAATVVNPPTDLRGFGHGFPPGPLRAGPEDTSSAAHPVPGAVVQLCESVTRPASGSPACHSPASHSPVKHKQEADLSVLTLLLRLAAAASTDAASTVAASRGGRITMQPVVGLVVPADAPAALCIALASAIGQVAAGQPISVIAAGDLAAGHGPKPPRPEAANVAGPFDERVVAGLDGGRPTDLVRIDRELAEQSCARAVGALRVLGTVLHHARLATVVRRYDAPLGVGCVVAQGG